MFFNNRRLGQTSQNQRVAATNHKTSRVPIYEEVSYGRRTSEYQGVEGTKEQGQYAAYAFNNGIYIPNQPSGIAICNKEEDAITHGLGSLKFPGPFARLNFPIPDHAMELGAMAQMTRDQDVANFNRHDGTRKWQAWTATETEEEAAIAFDLACIKQKGYQAITNYDKRYYDVQANMVNGNKPIQQRMEVETTWPVTAQVQAYPLTINKNDAGYRDNVQPTIYRARGFRPAKEGLTNFVAILGLEKHDNGSGLRFQHGDFSPFSFYQMNQVRKPVVQNTAFGLGHATASAFQSNKQTETGDHQYSSFAPQSAQNPWSFQPYSINLEREQWLNIAGLGFKHSSTSRFKVYEGNTIWKGKAKVNF